MSRTPSPPPESELPAGRVLPRIFTTRRVVPEPGSLFDILHRYARDSLYLAPICWTERHNELLVNRFTQLPLLETPVAPPSLYPSPPSPTHLLAPAIQSDTQDARLSKHLRTLMTPTDYHGQPYSYVNYSQDLRSKTMGLFLQEVFSGGDYWSNIKVPIRAGRHYHSGKFLCQGIWTPPVSRDARKSFAAVATARG